MEQAYNDCQKHFSFFHRYLRILSHMDMVDWKELQHGFIFGGNPKIFKITYLILERIE